MRQLIRDGKRRCYLCLQIFPLTTAHFYRNTHKRSGFGYLCKGCSKYEQRRFLKKRGTLIQDRNVTCARCGSSFSASDPRRKYCGSKVRRSGCSWLMRVEGRTECRRQKRGTRRLNLRFLTLTKYHYTCQYCGRKAPDVVLHVDHIKPRHYGGTNTLDNLTVACADCNLGKSDILLTEFMTPPTTSTT